MGSERVQCSWHNGCGKDAVLLVGLVPVVGGVAQIDDGSVYDDEPLCAQHAVAAVRNLLRYGLEVCPDCGRVNGKCEHPTRALGGGEVERG